MNELILEMEDEVVLELVAQGGYDPYVDGWRDAFGYPVLTH